MSRSGQLGGGTRGGAGDRVGSAEGARQGTTRPPGGFGRVGQLACIQGWERTEAGSVVAVKVGVVERRRLDSTWV
ncbi:hypothetical protein GCM10009534_71340 [Kribbella sandramycini]